MKTGARYDQPRHDQLVALELDFFQAKTPA
jgi:hypothetical protein